MNIALLKFKNAPAAGSEYGLDYTGLHHLGFQVEDLDETAQKFSAAGYEPRHDIQHRSRSRREPGKRQRRVQVRWS